MNNLTHSTDAPASVTYSLTRDGYPVLFTIRGEDAMSLLDEMDKIQPVLKERNYSGQEKKSFGKPVEYVEGRVCPKCGQALVYADIKGKKVIKCSTNKWNRFLNKAEGCAYIEWPEEQKEAEEVENVVNDLVGANFLCTVCSTKMVYKEGTTKTGKPYKAYFCPKDKNHPPKWLK